ncbi:MAG: carbamoyl-phosphate synthase (glutamine-hydrolyzing) large subunit [Deltaproteobacteria bacterium]|nr:carbamoyl-phosphate synthase (glutamine-hydrolyzing) large subunit [Deltaproteobacteria bacterium]
MVVGSGALKIGEAGEFDYSGFQALKAMREEGVRTVLVNPNIATNQTSLDLADEVYFLPATPDFVARVIERERPEGILLSFGGQTALNCGLALYDEGVLARHSVRVLGTPIESIRMTEERKRFASVLESIGVDTPESVSCAGIDEAVAAARSIGYPVIMRAGFSLGGQGSGVVRDDAELSALASIAFARSPEVLVEESLYGWKEVEYEVVRDAAGNVITVCNMENMDPLGIHTGESIVVAPSQTLDNDEYHMLRALALKVIEHLGIVGECNIQFALDPGSRAYRVIEVNARLSRSSALASKATGYPLAYVAAKLALGACLADLTNAVTQRTCAFFEPALDYLAVKIPRWDLSKFPKVEEALGTEMKSVGEVMAIGRSFEEALQKGVRMLGTGASGVTEHPFRLGSLTKELERPTPLRLFAVAEALKRGWSIKKVAACSSIDPWFVGRIDAIVRTRKRLEKARELGNELILESKKRGISDVEIGRARGLSEDEVRRRRVEAGITPVVKKIDTLAAEFPAETNYLYLTYHGTEDELPGESFRRKVVVLGSGPYSIGSSVEFDWCTVSMVNVLRSEGYETVVVNNNPETVSTDYDVSDRLYFEELTLERILDIAEKERPFGYVLCTGGQAANNLALPLASHGLNILGTPPEVIDRAEDRNKFSHFLDSIGVYQPRWSAFTDVEKAEGFAREVGYPVLIRPSYVLSGAAMRVCVDGAQLRAFLKRAALVTPEHPVVISKFEENAKEIEVDAVAHDGRVILYAISEHVENAGVHSGDATIVLPPQRLYLETIRRVKKITKKIASNLGISGPFNIQYLARDNVIKVIEANLRASRSFPFVSKVTGVDFIEVAALAILDRPPDRRYQTVDLDYVGVKAAQFSFHRLRGADPVLGVEMASTGEVATFGDDLYEAMLKSMMAVGFRPPPEGSAVLVSAGPFERKTDFLPSARRLAARGHPIFATRGTARFLRLHGVDARDVRWPLESGEPNALDLIRSGDVGLVINIPKNHQKREIRNDYLIRRTAVDHDVPLITNLRLADLIIAALDRLSEEDLKIKPWRSYLE